MIEALFKKNFLIMMINFYITSIMKVRYMYMSSFTIIDQNCHGMHVFG